MRQDYEKLFSNLQWIEPPRHLLVSILAQIRRERIVRARWRFALHVSLLIGSIVILISGSRYFLAEFRQSGFYQYLALLFLDGGFVIKFWHDFALSLVESLPLASGAVVLSGIFIFLISLKGMARDIKNVFAVAHITQLL